MLTVALFMLPIAGGLIATLLPAFGYLPAIGGQALGLDPWRQLLAQPGFFTSVWLSLTIGLLAALLSTVIALATVAVLSGGRLARWSQAALAPLLATPHSAMAIGLAFLIAPSGWLLRWVSPGLTGWTLPPDFATVGHASGAAVILALVIKEVPYLMLMIGAALQQVPAGAHLAIAGSLGYTRPTAWLKLILPQIYPQIRLPIYAVLAYSLSVVDVALVLGPGNPPPLAVLAVRWFAEPDVKMQFPASAAAMLQVLCVIAAIGLWHIGGAAIARCGRSWLISGRRTGTASAIARLGAALGIGGMALSALAMIGMALWSFASAWRFPAALPTAWTLSNWTRRFDGLLALVGNTCLIAVLATAIALLLVVGCLEAEQRLGLHPGIRSTWLLYTPLLVPQVSFLFGAQVALIRLGLDGTWLAVVWSHLLFVLPYLFLSLADPWRALDSRYARAALTLGASPGRVLLRVKLPMLLRPVLIACAVGFAVSVGQYLPTVFAGNGRIDTLTTEAITLSAGADRRLIGTFAFVQALLPVLVYGLALGIPVWRYRQRRGLHTHA